MASKTISSLVVSFFVLLIMLLDMAQSNSPNVQAFTLFQRLEGCQKGLAVKGLDELKQHLKKLGYLNYDHPNNRKHENANAIDNMFDDDLESAIKAYQINYRLNVTGSLDSDTVKQLMKPRCGVADVISSRDSMLLRAKAQHHQSHHNSKSLHATSHYDFFPGRPRWPHWKRKLRYNFHSSVQVPYLENVKSVCSRAFQRWSEVTQFTFEEVADDSIADIEIGFHRGDHGDSYPFDGPNGILAHSSAPTGGKLHYDADENWSSSDPGPDQVDLESVAVHEIGHLLGLRHSFDPDAVMFAYIDSGITKRDLREDDVQGIRNLYGLD